jgi:Ca2+-binding EF-hand superfamily protein
VGFGDPDGELDVASEDQRRELDEKVTALVKSRFAGDYQAAFTHYDADQSGTIDADELKTLLHDAGIGNALTRGAWVRGIIKELDADGDGGISWAEFDAVFQGK